MRKRISLLIAALMLALTMSFSGVAFGAITKENPGGKRTGGRGSGYSIQESRRQVPAWTKQGYLAGWLE
jgi:hypothetical protein